MINDYLEGGLKMIEIASFNKSLKATWIKKYIYLDSENHGKWNKTSLTHGAGKIRRKYCF